jgi:hypothetical protein
VGKVVAIAIALIAGLALFQSAIALSGTFVWISIAVAALVVFVALVVYRRFQAASDLALADARRSRTCFPSGTAAGISRRDAGAPRRARSDRRGWWGVKLFVKGRGPTEVDPLLLTTTLVDRTS